MNGAFIFLWVIIIILLIVCVSFSVKNVNIIKDFKNIFVVDFNQNLCYPNGSATNLKPVSGQCCVVDGVATSTQTLSPYNAPELSFLISSVPTSYTSVCYGYCETVNPLSGVCEDTTGKYVTCLQVLKPPTGCKDYANPLAQRNGVPYYANKVYVATIPPSDNDPGNLGNCPTTVTC